MIRISLPYLYELSATLKPLNTLAGSTPINVYLYVLYGAEQALEGFLYKSVYVTSLKATQAPGGSLLMAIKKLTAAPDKDRLLDFIDVWSIHNGLAQFETVLNAEMNLTPAFFVSKKRGFDTVDLIDQAEILFPSDFVAKVPEARDEIRQAGKCLAFEIPTACGFHIMRGLEVVLRVYFDIVTKGADRPKTHNMGDYLRTLEEKKCGHDKIIPVLRQIKDLHRNELIHPEVTLSLDEALALWGIVQSAICCMLEHLPEKTLELTGESA